MIRPFFSYSIVLLYLGLSCSVFAERVHITVKDGETGQTVPARAFLRCAGRPVFPSGAPSYRRGVEEHFLLSGADTLDLPGGQCQIEVTRGLEYEPSKVDQLIRYTETKGVFRKPEDGDETLSLYRQARVIYERLAAGSP